MAKADQTDFSSSPVFRESRTIEDGIALALSGGGFRATLFHVGTLWRLNELGVLPKLERISSVSGGSIAAAQLAVSWSDLTFRNDVALNFIEYIVSPLRRFCGLPLDLPAICFGFLPGCLASDAVTWAYDAFLYKAKTLQDLPDRPRFVLNATNTQTGRAFRFSKPYMGDYRIGLIEKPTVPVSVAVAASSAFPPFLSPVILRTDPSAFKAVSGADLAGVEAYCRNLYLTDGGVYDNLGLETVWMRYRTVVVSDAGAPFLMSDTFSNRWLAQTRRALDIATDQSRALRKRYLFAEFGREGRNGTYWGIDTKIDDYELADALRCDRALVQELAAIRTRLNRFTTKEQERLINWGYALCDAAMRRYVYPGLPPPPGWPYPEHALG